MEVLQRDGGRAGRSLQVRSGQDGESERRAQQRAPHNAPRKKPSATPAPLASTTSAVARFRCRSGNHVTDTLLGALCTNAAPKPPHAAPAVSSLFTVYTHTKSVISSKYIQMDIIYGLQTAKFAHTQCDKNLDSDQTGRDAKGSQETRRWHSQQKMIVFLQN